MWTTRPVREPIWKPRNEGRRNLTVLSAVWTTKLHSFIKRGCYDQWSCHISNSQICLLWLKMSWWSPSFTTRTDILWFSLPLLVAGARFWNRWIRSGCELEPGQTLPGIKAENYSLKWRVLAAVQIGRITKITDGNSSGLFRSFQAQPSQPARLPPSHSNQAGL